MALFRKRVSTEKVISQKVKNRDLFLKNFHKYLRSFSDIVLFVHERPDGDCLGGAFGLKEVLNNQFSNKNIYVVGDRQEAFPWLHMEFDELDPDFDFSAAVAIILDAGVGSRVQKFQEYFKNLGVKRWGAVIRIDHHDTNLDYYTDLSWIDASYASCCAQLVQICDYYQWKMDSKAATYFYLGIMTDSGSFSNSEVSPRTFVLAAKALRAGADREFLVNNLKRVTREELKLRAEILSNLVQEDRFIWYFMRKPLVDQYRPYSITSKLINSLGHIEDNVLWMLLTEEEIGTIRVNLRSIGELDVRKIAEEFGGGGHINAAGIILDNQEKVPQLVARVQEAVHEFIASQEEGSLSKDAALNLAKEKFQDDIDPEYRLDLTPEEKDTVEETRKLLQETEFETSKTEQITDLSNLTENDPEWENLLTEAQEKATGILSESTTQEPLAGAKENIEKEVDNDDIPSSKVV